MDDQFGVSPFSGFRSPAWSPDQERLVMYAPTDPLAELHMIDTDGTGLTCLLGNDPACLLPSGISFNSHPWWAVSFDPFTKEIASGPDGAGDGAIDLAVAIGQTQATAYDFKLTYGNAEGRDVVIEDTVPAEWAVVDTMEEPATGLVEFIQHGSKAKGSTKVLWTPDPNDAVVMLTVSVETRGPKKPHG